MSEPLSPLIEQGTDVITSNVDSAVPISSKSGTLREAVRTTVKEYFLKLDGATPHHFYDLFMVAIESPLLEIVLQYCQNNQSAAAKLLNLSRGLCARK